MARRPHWKGYLKLSLVSCPIALYPAISAAERISFRQVNKETGNRLRQQLVDSVTGEPVQAHDKGRGYEVGENQFLVVQDEELEAARHEARTRPYSAVPASNIPPASGEISQEQPAANRGAAQRREELRHEEAPPLAPPAPPPVRIENNHTIEIERFVPRAQIDARYPDKPYYIVPRDQVGQEAFAVIRDAMRRKDMVGMGRVVLSNRERPIMVEPMGNGLRGVTLRYNHEVRSEAEYFADIPQIALPDEMIRVAEHILETKKADFDTAYLEDRYRTVLVSMLREKKAEMPRGLGIPAPPSPQNVINLMDALQRSLAAEQPGAESAAPKSSPRRTAAGIKPNAAKRSSARARRTG
jgi:non-homologous end joining protein Ku